ncbi:MAG: hypothetical protein NWF04_02520 [Candidatus Bathyarchaeota archaeon]|nr:hypothetical protein [Candidatus Bathyarchaeota archaeon]
MMKKSKLLIIMTAVLAGFMMMSLVPQGQASLTYNLTVSYDVVGGGDPNPPTLHYCDLLLRSRTYTLSSEPHTLMMWGSTEWSVEPGNVLDASKSERWYSSDVVWSGTAPKWGGSDTYVWTYTHQVKVHFDTSNQVKKDTSSPVVTVNDQKVRGSQLPYTTGWINSGSYLSYRFESPIASSSAPETSYLWSATQGMDQNLQGNSFKVKFPGTITAQYATATVSKYEVSFAASPVGGGVVTPSETGMYEDGAQIPIMATANDGYVFKEWKTKGNIHVDDKTSTSTTATIKGSGTITATFKPGTLAPTELTIYCNPETVDKTGSNTTNITGKLTSNGAPVPSKTVIISYFDGAEWIKIGGFQTGPDGVYLFVCDVPEEIENGLYAMKAEFMGDSCYKASTAATGTVGNSGHLLVVPEYYFGGLASVAICFAALLVFKNRKNVSRLYKNGENKN